ncbi:hypothetical protein L7F22_011932 [Adiantum nelumboides]|nr:hypothetical protein [Adiantum nelumboides]
MSACQDNGMQHLMHQFAALMHQQHLHHQQMMTQSLKREVEARIGEARQAVTDKLGRFEGRDISKFCKVYEQVMEDKGVEEHAVVENFVLVVVPELHARIEKLRTTHGVTWASFKQALKDE